MLEVRDLHVKFHNRDREAVAGVSFTLRDGEILGLVGESGSGKSVTAMSIAGLLPRKKCDYRGDVLVDGEDMLHANRALLRKVQGNKIGVVFQEPMSAMDPLTGDSHGPQPRGAQKESAPGPRGRRTSRSGGGLQQVPSRTLRRNASEVHDRGGNCGASQPSSFGRAHNGAGCDDPGSDS